MSNELEFGSATTVAFSAGRGLAWLPCPFARSGRQRLVDRVGQAGGVGLGAWEDLDGRLGRAFGVEALDDLLGQGDGLGWSLHHQRIGLLLGGNANLGNVLRIGAPGAPGPPRRFCRPASTRIVCSTGARSEARADLQVNIFISVVSVPADWSSWEISFFISAIWLARPVSSSVLPAMSGVTRTKSSSPVWPGLWGCFCAPCWALFRAVARASALALLSETNSMVMAPSCAGHVDLLNQLLHLRVTSGAAETTTELELRLALIRVGMAPRPVRCAAPPSG